MDVPFTESSNTLSLITWLLGLQDATFAEKCENGLGLLSDRLTNADRSRSEWKRLLRTKGQIEGFIRHDREQPVRWNAVKEFAVAA